MSADVWDVRKAPSCCWLHRIQSRGLEGRYDRRSPGRRCKLSEEQQKEIHGNLSREPQECRFERETWSSSSSVQYILQKFGVQYGPREALMPNPAIMKPVLWLSRWAVRRQDKLDLNGYSVTSSSRMPFRRILYHSSHGIFSPAENSAVACHVSAAPFCLMQFHQQTHQGKMPSTAFCKNLLSYTLHYTCLILERLS